MNKSVLASVFAFALVGVPPTTFGASDTFVWRQYLSPTDWKSYDQLITRFTEASAMTAVQKTRCQVPLGMDSEDRFLNLLTGTNLLRKGSETEVPKSKYRAWINLMSIGGTACNADALRSETRLKERWYQELLELQVRGFQNMTDGKRKYR